MVEIMFDKHLQVPLEIALASFDKEYKTFETCL